MPALRFVPPERRWRAALMAVPAAWLGWRIAILAGPLAGCLVGVGLLGLAVPVMRTVDLLSTRVHTCLPSAEHLDDLQRICWTRQERLAANQD